MSADHAQPLREEDVGPDPLSQFHAWFDEATAAGVRAPEAAAVATATADGEPSVRMVLVKVMDERGFVFFTNYESRKGVELRENPRAALLFHWDALGRQVRINGDANPVSREETIVYARTRPRGAQISALASAQSRPVRSREQLESRVRELAEQYPDEVPVPESWGGFRLTPERYEFWQNRSDRLHDRLVYTRAADGGWRIERLAP